MEEYLKVKNHSNLVRDAKTKAILNTDTKSLESYRQQQTLYERLGEVDKLRNDVHEIKELLQKLLEKR